MSRKFIRAELWPGQFARQCLANLPPAVKLDCRVSVTTIPRLIFPSRNRASRRSAVGLAGCALWFVPNHSQLALIPDTSGLDRRSGPARAAHLPMAGVWLGGI